jgi:hypothetical protein
MCNLAYICQKFSAFYAAFYAALFAPGKFLQTVEMLLLLHLSCYIVFDGAFELTKRLNWIIPQFVYGCLCAASFYLAVRVDARNPPLSQNAKRNRMISSSSHVFFLAVLEWSLRNVVRDMPVIAYVGHLVAVNTALYVRFVSVFSMLYHEIPNSVQKIRCIELWAEFALLLLTITLGILHNYLPGSNYESIVFLLVRTFLFYSSVSITHVVAGKYRTIAIHVRVQHVLNIVEEEEEVEVVVV